MTHPNCPRKLAHLYKRLGTIAAVSRNRGVNIRYVYDAIVYGLPPSTKNTRARKLLYFPKTDRKPAGSKQRAPSPDWINWWRHLPKDDRRAKIQNLYKQEFHK